MPASAPAAGNPSAETGLRGVGRFGIIVTLIVVAALATWGWRLKAARDAGVAATMGRNRIRFSLLRENWGKCDDPSVGLDSGPAQV
jgi:hypothetical protein